MEMLRRCYLSMYPSIYLSIYLSTYLSSICNYNYLRVAIYLWNFTGTARALQCPKLLWFCLEPQTSSCWGLEPLLPPGPTYSSPVAVAIWQSNPGTGRICGSFAACRLLALGGQKVSAPRTPGRQWNLQDQDLRNAFMYLPIYSMKD